MTKPSNYTFKMLEQYGRQEETYIRPDKQDRSSDAWQKLLALIDQAAKEEWTEFQPAKYLGRDLWKQITVLPNEIAKLTKVKKLYLQNLRTLTLRKILLDHFFLNHISELIPIINVSLVYRFF